MKPLVKIGELNNTDCICLSSSEQLCPYAVTYNFLLVGYALLKKLKTVCPI